MLPVRAVGQAYAAFAGKRGDKAFEILLLVFGEAGFLRHELARDGDSCRTAAIGVPNGRDLGPQVTDILNVTRWDGPIPATNG